jgi:hypothetical protein
LSRTEFHKLTPADATALDRLRALVNSLIAEHYGDLALRGGPSDIPWLQRLLNDKVFAAGQTNGFLAIGVAFGDVLASEFSLHWTMITESGWSQPALRLDSKTLTVRAYSMVLALVEQGESVDLARQFAGLKEAWPKIVSEAR